MQTSKRIINALCNIQDVSEGIKNFNHIDDNIEKKALERSKECVNCDNYIDEPIKQLHVVDRIDCLSGKMCNLCGCILAYKLRIENIKTKNCPLNGK